MITRFNVPHLYKLNKKLVSVASGKIMPDLVIYNGNILSTYTDRILKKKEIWIYNGRIAAIKDNLSAFKIFNKKDINAYDAEFNLLAVPYLAAKKPSARSKYTDIILTIFYTFLLYGTYFIDLLFPYSFLYTY